MLIVVCHIAVSVLEASKFDVLGKVILYSVSSVVLSAKLQPLRIDPNSVWKCKYVKFPEHVACCIINHVKLYTQRNVLGVSGIVPNPAILIFHVVMRQTAGIVIIAAIEAFIFNILAIPTKYV